MIPQQGRRKTEINAVSIFPVVVLNVTFLVVLNVAFSTQEGQRNDNQSCQAPGGRESLIHTLVRPRLLQ